MSTQWYALLSPLLPPPCSFPKFPLGARFEFLVPFLVHLTQFKGTIPVHLPVAFIAEALGHTRQALLVNHTSTLQPRFARRENIKIPPIQLSTFLSLRGLAVDKLGEDEEYK